MLEALKRAAGEDLDFATFLIKYLYAVHQVTPPCPQLDPQLLTEAKELWGLHTGKRAIEALTAKEEDTLDEVVGRPPVVRCRVCHKLSETGVHPECQTRGFLCEAKRVTWADDAWHERVVGCGHTAELPPVTLPRTLTTQRDSLRLADALWGPVRCPQCGCASIAITKDCPECRPGSSKVSRKRKM